MDFTSLVNSGATSVTEVQATPGITVNLSKGNVLDLSKAAPSLVNALFATGWDANDPSGKTFDLDLSIFMCRNGKFVSSSDLLFYGTPGRTANGVTHMGDNLTGAGDGDDETVSINLSALPADIDKLVGVVTIYDATSKQQTFGMVKNAYARLVNKDTGQEIARFALTDNAGTETALIFAELVRDNGAWKFHAVQEGLVGDLNTIAARLA